MNWMSEAQLSHQYLQWMRQTVAECGDNASQALPHVIRGLERWDEAVARDRHATGDENHIAHNEYFHYAVATLSRATREAVEEALNKAIEWHADDPMVWPSIDLDEARGHWAASHHVVTNVLDAWITLWNDLAPFQGRLSGATWEEILDQWQGLADQACETVSGVAAASWAQCR